MAWGKPTRNVKCTRCGRRGTCSCQRALNAELTRNTAAAPRTCTAACRGKGSSCGRTIRGGVCPCGYC